MLKKHTLHQPYESAATNNPMVRAATHKLYREDEDDDTVTAQLISASGKAKLKLNKYTVFSTVINVIPS